MECNNIPFVAGFVIWHVFLEVRWPLIGARPNRWANARLNFSKRRSVIYRPICSLISRFDIFCEVSEKLRARMCLYRSRN
jgi:hypothetical protein